MGNEISERGVLHCSKVTKKEGAMSSLFWCTQSIIIVSWWALNQGLFNLESPTMPSELPVVYFDQLLGAARTQKHNSYPVLVSFFIIFASKFSKNIRTTRKKEILLSVWSAQHLNSGQNIQNWDIYMIIAIVSCQQFSNKHKKYQGSQYEG